MILMMPSISWAQINIDPNLKPQIINGKYCYDSAGIIKIANLKKDLQSINYQKEALETLLEIEGVDKRVIQDQLSDLKREEKGLRKQIRKLERKAFMRGFGWGNLTGSVAVVLLIVLI